MNKLKDRAVFFAKELAHKYFIERDFEKLLSHLDTDISWIGTSKYEICKKMSDAIYLLNLEQQRYDNNFEIENEWYYPIEISDTVCIVIGELSFKKNLNTKKLLEVPIRFTIICKLYDNNIKLIHFHNSVAYEEQAGNKPIKSINKSINIDALKRENEILRLKAQLDPLTKLYNKMISKSLIDNYLKTQNIKASHALMIIDIDNFKAVNDNLGHMFGDSVLAEIASNIKKTFSNSNIIGRIGGDEFIIFLKNVDNIELISKKACNICDIFKNTYTGENKDYKISCSIGISIFPVHGKNYHELFKKADYALYRAKSDGKDCFEIYDENTVYNFNTRKTDLFNSYTKTDTYNRSTNTFKNKLVAYAFDILSETKDVDSAINLILSKIGKYFNLSRISILESSIDNINFSITYEWCNDGIKSYKSHLKNLLFNDWINYFSSFDKNGIFSCSDYSKLKLSPKNKEIYDKFEAKSFLQCLILDNRKYKGCVSFYNSYENHCWNINETQLFTTITKIISSYLLKMRTNELLEEEKLLTQAVAKNQNLYTYVLKPDSYELMYLSANTQALYPNAKVGDICYKAFFNSDTPCLHCPLSGLNNNCKCSNTLELFSQHLGMWLSVTASEITLSENNTAILVCFSDITNFLDRITSKDSLTGLMTLSKFEVVATELLNKSVNDKYALIYSDFDKFKYINETAGYAVGNNVLVRFSSLASNFIQSNELLCRPSADNFLTLIKYKDIETLKSRLYEFNSKLIEMQKKEFSNMKISVISGIYLINNKRLDLSTIIDRANVARKTIKGSHKSQYAFYDCKLHIQATKEKKIESIMVSALENKEFFVYLQPKIELSTKNIVGAEALVRWIRPNNNIIFPGEFISLFEKNGFIVDLDFYVYEEVFKIMRKWIDEKKTIVPISMNVSRAHINDDTFIPNFKKLTDKYNIPVNLIELELTENIFFDNINDILKRIKELKSLGFTFSIDDFGSGYSSLNLLKELPIDVLKLDKGFFPNNNIDKKEKVIVSNIVKMAKDLNILVLSEGIETKEQVDFLTDIGCNMVQGYFFYKPMTINNFEKKLWN